MENTQEVKFRIVKSIGTISDSTVKNVKWVKRLNLISWGGRPPKFDLRPWGPNNTPGRGITLTYDELVNLVKESVKFFKESKEVELDLDISNISDSYWDSLLGE